MTKQTHISVTTFSQDTDRTCEIEYMGAYTEAKRDLHSVNIHAATGVTRKTKTINGTKHTRIIIHTLGGDIDITAYYADTEGA